MNIASERHRTPAHRLEHLLRPRKVGLDELDRFQRDQRVDQLCPGRPAERQLVIVIGSRDGVHRLGLHRVAAREPVRKEDRESATRAHIDKRHVCVPVRLEAQRERVSHLVLRLVCPEPYLHAFVFRAGAFRRTRRTAGRHLDVEGRIGLFLRDGACGQLGHLDDRRDRVPSLSSIARRSSRRPTTGKRIASARWGTVGRVSRLWCFEVRSFVECSTVHRASAEPKFKVSRVKAPYESQPLRAFGDHR